MVYRAHVVVNGRVQGVGYRFAAYRRALELALNGWVRNRADGRVEAELEGPREAIEAMIAWCESGPPLARVTDVRAEWEQGEPRHATFSIRG